MLALICAVGSTTYWAILEGRVKDGPHLGRRGKSREIENRPGLDMTLSVPEPASPTAMAGVDERNSGIAIS